MTVIFCVLMIVSLLVTTCIIGFPLGGWTLGLACILALGYFLAKIEEDDTQGAPAVFICTISCALIILVSIIYLDRKAADEKQNIQVQCQDGMYWPK